MIFTRQARIHTKILQLAYLFADKYAMGTVTYSKTFSEQKYLSVKLPKGWEVIDHSGVNSFKLPDVQTAEKYKLPKGWYANS